MTAPVSTPDTEVIETWEIVSEGTVWVWTRDVRRPGYMQKTRVGGKAGGSRRLRITRDERRYNEEQIIEEMREWNPFRNGALKMIASRGEIPDDVDTTYHLDNGDLLALFDLKDEELFRAEIEAVRSELVLRRLYMIAEKAATVAQLAVVKETIEGRFGVGGTQQSIREQDTAGYRGISLSGS